VAVACESAASSNRHRVKIRDVADTIIKSLYGHFDVVLAIVDGKSRKGH
jgi:hypothetical protein